jgi:ABC-type lipoprotein release transport system permease subunit
MLRGVLGFLGLVMASIGLYAVVAYAVTRRSREIGIRMALGARSRQVVSSIARGVAGLIAAIAPVTAPVGVAAAFVPGRRAALMDPLVALRHD